MHVTSRQVIDCPKRPRNDLPIVYTLKMNEQSGMTRIDYTNV
jgi:hypothetical protein